MKNLLTPSRTLAVPLLMGYWTCAVAQSLGTPAADLWIGQPLDMSVPARLGSAEGEDPCVGADVYYGDKHIRSGVRATLVGTDGNRRVRIQSDTPVDEPVVNVSLRAGCRNFVTRNYTLLPDIPSESVIAALMRPQAPALVTATAPAGVPLRLTPGPQGSPLIRPPRRMGAEVVTAVATAAPSPSRFARGLHKAAPARGARLQLEPIDTDPQSFLRASASLADPQGDASRRATAAALWQAINADPQDILRTSALLHKLEGEMVQLRRTALQTNRDMADLRRRLDEAQPWYASPRAIQVLGALVLAAAAAAGMLWFRTRRLEMARGPWYAPATQAPEPVQAPVATPAQVVAPQPVVVRAPVRAEPEPAPAVAVREVTGVPQPVSVVVPELAPVAARRSGPGPIEFSAPETPRRAAIGMLRVETLAATLEEVEFLSSLGLAVDAMEVLKTYLHDSSSPSPLAYFELMRLCDQDEDPAAVMAVRRRYAQVFGLEAPALPQITAARGLEAVPELSQRITRAWDSALVLDLIEEALFTVPAPGAALTLQAGRDLICLHDLAMALVTDAGPHGADVESQPLAPWAHAEDPAGAHAAAQAIADADGGHHFALDVDLNAAPGRLPETQVPATEPELELELELAPLIAEMQATAEREAQARAQARAQAEAEDAFSAAVAGERAR